jgi:anti-sigma factor RsiW
MTEPRELTCQELVTLVTEYLEGTLSLEDRARFDQHIAGCQGCTNYLAQMNKTLQALHHLPVEAVTPEAERDLRHHFRNWKKSTGGS